MMRIGRCRQVEQRLQKSLDMRCRKQVMASRHQRYALIGIVDDHRKMIGSRHLFSRENNVAELKRIGDDRTPLAR